MALHFRLEDLGEDHLHDELMWCLVVFQHDLHGQCLPKGKEKLLLKDPLSQKGKLFTSASTRTESHDRNEYYNVITKQMNFNCPFHCNQ